jgi:hypothetical protein
LSEDLRSRLTLPEGFRFLREGDIGQVFRTGNEMMDRYVLRDYYRWSLLPNDLVVLYEIDRRIAGIIELRVNENHIMVDMVGSNVLVQAPGVGTKLMSLAENFARQLAIGEIRLDSLDDVVSWYGSFGYAQYADRCYDAELGCWLTPMKKLIR